MPKDFPAAFAALREIANRHSTGLKVISDTPTDFTAITEAIALNKKPLWFVSVLSKKSAVTYHLMPLYFNPKLQAKIPPTLAKRKQGKTCFNFQQPDDSLFAELDQLTAHAREAYKAAGFLNAGQITAEQLDAALRMSGENPEEIAKDRKRKLKSAASKRAKTQLQAGAGRFSDPVRLVPRSKK